MTQEQIAMAVEKIKLNHLISSDNEAMEAIEFVAELLELAIDETEANEPYATRSIQEFKTAFERVRSLDSYLEK